MLRLLGFGWPRRCVRSPPPRPGCAGWGTADPDALHRIRAVYARGTAVPG